jgi:carboxylate-amine ligase
MAKKSDYTISSNMVENYLTKAGIPFSDKTTLSWNLTVGMEIEIFLAVKHAGKFKMLTHEKVRDTILYELAISLGKKFCNDNPVCPIINEDGTFKFVDIEYWTSIIELGTPPSETISQQEYYYHIMMQYLIKICAKYGVYPMAVSTPVNKQRGWRRSNHERYIGLKKILGNVLNNFKIAGTQSQVFIPNEDIRVRHTRPAMNIGPIFTALTASSPIFMGEYQHKMACRYSKWRRFPRTDIPQDEVNLSNASGFRKYLANILDVVEAKVPGFLTKTHDGQDVPDPLQNASRVYWAPVRPNQTHRTGEARSAETTPYIADSVAMAAMYRAFVRYIIRHPEYEMMDRSILKHNIKEAETNGMEGIFYNEHGEKISFDTYLAEFLELIYDDAVALGDWDFIYSQTRVIQERGTASDKLIEIWKKHAEEGNTEAAQQTCMAWLIKETKKEAYLPCKLS